MMENGVMWEGQKGSSMFDSWSQAQAVVHEAQPQKKTQSAEVFHIQKESMSSTAKEQNDWE